MSKWLTKSDYLRYLTHPAYLWLYKYDKERLPPYSENAKAAMAQGNLVETYARELFDGGATVTSLFFEAVRDTEELVKRGERTIFQATVHTQRNLYAMADMLVKLNDDEWDMYEVKSSTKAKDTYLADLSFQKIAFEEFGITIRRSHLIYINSSYVRRGDVDPFRLFTVRDVTKEVADLVPQTLRNIEGAIAVLTQRKCPRLNLGDAGNFYEWREIYRYLNRDLPKDHIINLCRLDASTYRAISERGIERIQDVPANVPLKRQQLTQIQVTKADKATMNLSKIAAWLKKLTYPIWFLDYETTFPAVPAYDGTRPYQQIPFQFALDMIEAPGAPVKHYDFLARDSKNPMPSLLANLASQLGKQGSVIVWNKAFEQGINSSLGQQYPDYAEYLLGVNRRMRDLMDVFDRGWYADPAFMGSASIKKVLPVMVPELTYSELAIGEGQMASNLWANAAFGRVDAQESKQIFEDLIEYCSQDTLAMVKILAKLEDVVSTLPVQDELWASS